MQSFNSIWSSASPTRWLVLLASAVGIIAVFARPFESDDAKRKRIELRKKKELRLLAERIYRKLNI